MRTVSIQKAKALLSRLVEDAAQGESFVIMKAGRPLVKAVAVEGANISSSRHFGFLKGECVIPDDFDEMAREEIEKLFHGDL